MGFENFGNNPEIQTDTKKDVKSYPFKNQTELPPKVEKEKEIITQETKLELKYSILDIEDKLFSKAIKFGGDEIEDFDTLSKLYRVKPDEVLQLIEENFEENEVNIILKTIEKQNKLTLNFETFSKEELIKYFQNNESNILQKLEELDIIKLDLENFSNIDEILYSKDNIFEVITSLEKLEKEENLDKESKKLLESLKKYNELKNIQSLREYNTVQLKTKIKEYSEIKEQKQEQEQNNNVKNYNVIPNNSEYTLNNSTYNPSLTSPKGDKIEISIGQAKMIEANPEIIDTVINLNTTLVKVGLPNIIKYIDKISNAIGTTGGVNNNDKSLENNEIQKFLNNILLSVGKTEIEPTTSLKQYVNNFNQVNNVQVSGNHKDSLEIGSSNIEEIFMKKYITGFSNFQTDAFQNDIQKK